MPAASIYHICSRADWLAAEAEGRYPPAGSTAMADGFLHFSAADQIAASARLHWAGKADLVLLAVAPEALGDALKWEASRGGALFPHLYGDLPLGAVTAVHDLPLGADGLHGFPPLD